MAQQGYVNTGMVRAHMEPFMPGQIATLYPKAIKTGVFKESAPGKVLQFGVGCARKGASNTTVYTPNNFGESMRPGKGDNVGVPEYGPTKGTDPEEYRRNMATYAAGGGAYITDEIKVVEVQTGKLKAVFTTSSTTVQIENDGASHYDLINVGDYIRIVDSTNNIEETVRVANINAIGAADITYSVLRAVSGYTKASGSLEANSKVYKLEGGGSTGVPITNFAGVVIKDITIDGRWVANEYDAFVDGDHVPVGVEGDYAIRVCGKDGVSQADIKPDDPVSIFIGKTQDYGTSQPHPRTHGYFSNVTNISQDFLVIPGARFITGHADITTTNPGTRGPGSGWKDNQTVRCAVARFAGNV